MRRNHTSKIIFFCATVVALLPLSNIRADAPPTRVTIHYTGTDFEGRQGYQFQWTAVPNASYLVQSTTNLMASDTWKTVDLVTPTNGAGVYVIKGRSIPENSVEFFRLILPQPQIFSIEPGVFASDTSVDAFVIGQCLESNDVVRVDGTAVGGVTYVNTGLLQFTIPPSSVGLHLVELLRGGLVESSFTVKNSGGVPTGDLTFLQGPPDDPPASPKQRPRNTKGGIALFDGSNDGIRAIGASGTGTGPNGQGLRIAGATDDDCDDGEDLSSSPLSSLLMPALMKAKEKANRTKCSSNLRQLPSARDCDDGDPDLRLLLPALMKAKEKANRSHIWGGGGGTRMWDSRSQVWNAFRGMSGGVAPHSGEVEFCEVDIFIPGRGLDFVWGRTYHSRIGRSSSSSNGWTFSYDLNIQPLGGDIVVHNGTGRADTFRPGTNGVYTCPEFFSEGTLSNNVFKLSFADSGYWEFNPLSGAAEAGKLAKIVDRNGNMIALHYDVSGRLAELVDDLARTNLISYNASGQLASVTDFSGRTVTYHYYTGLPADQGGAGDLASVTSPPVTGTPNGNDFPAGKTNSYTYTKGFPLAQDSQNHLLLSCVDALGVTNRQFSYDLNTASLSYLRCVSMQRWTNGPTMFTYLPQAPTPANQFTTLRCIINDPVGNVTECYYDARNRCVKLQEFTGRAKPGESVTDSVNRPAGKLRSSDPDYYETRMAWNNDSYIKIATYPGSDVEICAYESDFNPSASARKRGDLRSVRQVAASAVDLDGDGLADTKERVWFFEYDPRFGSECATCRGIIAAKPGTGSAGRITACAPNGVHHEVRAFATSVTDPRGFVTTGTYDASGNCLRVHKRPELLYQAWDETFAYNAYGQLTAITNAPDANGYTRVDTFDYYTNGPQMGYLQQCVRDLLGHELTHVVQQDNRGNVLRYVDPLGYDTLYTYNALDQCVRMQTPTNLTQRCITDLYYDANDNLVECTTELRDAADTLVCGKTDHFRCNPLHLVTRFECAVDCSTFMTNDLVYNANDQCVLALGGDAVSGVDPHQAMAYEYDERRMLFREIGAPGSTRSPTNEWSYTINGSPATKKYVDDQDTLKTSFTYDGFEAFGAEATAGDGKDDLLAAASGKTKKGDKVSLVGFGSFSTSRLVRKARVWILAGAANNRLATITDPMGNVTTLNHDANDNLKVVRRFGETTDVSGGKGNIRLAESRCDYNGLDRLIRRRDSHFNSVGQTIGDGYRTTTFAYAANGQCTSVTDDLGRITAFAYDTAGRGTNVTSPEQRTEFAILRDRNGRATSCVETDHSELGGAPQVFAWTNVFDSLGRCVSTTDNVGNTNRSAYDSLGRCVKSIDSAGTVSFEHDFLDRQTLAVCDLDQDGLLDLAHDAFTSSVWSSSSGRLLFTTDSHTNTTGYAYDSLNRCIQITQADGTHCSLIWSPRSNLIQETDANGTVVIHTYDLNDRCVSNHIVTGAGVASTTTAETYAYDGCSRLVAATNDAWYVIIGYDSLGNPGPTIQDGLLHGFHLRFAP